MQQAAYPPNIVVLDVDRVFKECNQYKAMKSQLDGEAMNAEAEFKKEGDQLRKMAEGLREYAPGSNEYKQLEEACAKRESEIKVNATLKSREFQERNAKIDHFVYQAMVQEVQAVVTQNNISMVVNANTVTVDPQRIDQIRLELMQPVIWYPKERDITPVVIARMNRVEMNPGLQNPGNGQALRTGVPQPNGYANPGGAMR